MQTLLQLQKPLNCSPFWQGILKANPFWLIAKKSLLWCLAFTYNKSALSKWETTKQVIQVNMKYIRFRSVLGVGVWTTLALCSYSSWRTLASSLCVHLSSSFLVVFNSSVSTPPRFWPKPLQPVFIFGLWHRTVSNLVFWSRLANKLEPWHNVYSIQQ